MIVPRSARPGSVTGAVLHWVTVFRDHCLSLPHDSQIAITNVQQTVDEDVAYGCGVRRMTCVVT
jgi:hypothetical protein